jgi:predicted secreted Zn-dependent protease
VRRRRLESFVNFRFCLVAAAVVAAGCAPARSENPTLDKFSRLIGTNDLKYYDVQGRTPGDVAKSMQALGPEANEFFGHPRSSYSATWHKRKDGAGQCDLLSVQVTTASQMMLPRWTPPADTGPGSSAEWRRFMSALQRHQVEHKRISDRGARQLLDGLLGLKTFCSEVPRDVKRLTDSINVQTQSRQAAYDLRTHRGGTQGAVFLAWLP